MLNGESKLIAVYDGNPKSNGKLYGKYLLKKGAPLALKLNIPTATQNLYIMAYGVGNASSVYQVSSSGSSGSVTPLALMKSGIKLLKAAPVSPDCSYGCTSNAAGSNQNLNLNSSSDVVCIVGSFEGNININRGTVRICGKADIKNISINNDGVLLIASSAQVEIGNFNLNTQSSTFRNWSNSIKINSNFSPNGIVSNYATLEVSGDLNINGNSNFTNDGALRIAGSFNNNKTFINSGSCEVGKNFNINGGASTTNNCYLRIGEDFNLNNSINVNGGGIIVGKSTTINGGGILNLNNGAILTTQDLTANNIVNGSGSTSFAKVSQKTIINGGGKFTGNFSFCDESGIETNWGSISNTVVQDCKTYIPKTECNQSGNGEAPKSNDNDKDGVDDDKDEYPEDENRAFNNFYPNSKDMVTVAFEDLWPSKGDYDLNDCVVDFKYNLITNAKNEVIKVEANYTLRASGGNQAIAFCHNFPIKPEFVTELNGAKLEDKNETTIITIFTNSKVELGGWNTVPTQNKVEAKEYAVSFTLKEPISLENFGELSEFDPFIWINEPSKGRQYEIHLPGKQATVYADKKLFGYADDNSNEGELNYLTKAGLPWAILVPEKFDYCAELKTINVKEVSDITQVYLHFSQWAQSGGRVYTDWYKNEKGYRDDTYIYLK
jgi:LruC domain-containing protein